MIKVERLSANALRVAASERLTLSDFRLLAPPIDAMVDRNRKLRLLVDLSEFEGWENLKAFELHSGFVKTHQMYVERLAVIASPEWPAWLIETGRMFLHRDAKAFNRAQEAEAMRWVAEP